MKILLLIVITITFSISGLSVGMANTPEPVPSVSQTRPVKKRMKAFKSERELARYFAVFAEQHRREQARLAAKAKREAERAAKPSGDTVTILADSAMLMTETVSVTGSAPESITNTQHAGVDEGGIVKVHGNHLVVLRRGRLFTIAINDAELKPISTVNAYGPEVGAQSTWYDEMLISNNTVVVIGYSYGHSATEVGLFNISNEGQLAYRSTYHVRSGDYYSSRNYASRLIGSKLIFYTPQRLNPYDDRVVESFPTVRKWHKDAGADEFDRFVTATRIYRPADELKPEIDMTLHTVTVCDLANGGLDCRGTSVLGRSGRVFYVSAQAVYVWSSASGANRQSNSIVFRLPLDGSGPSALRVSGSPVDQFSFLESEDQHLNVLVRAESAGDGMWSAEVSSGEVALMRIPIRSFSDGSDYVPAYRYRQLQEPAGDTFQNRFVGNYLLYGTGNGWGYSTAPTQPTLFIVDWRTGTPHQLHLQHGVDRIEALGSDAVIVGGEEGNLHFSSVRLNLWPEVVSRYTRPQASQGELRSHGFFYKPEGVQSGTLGLPIRAAGRPGYEHLFHDSAAILFLRNNSLRFNEVGELGAQPENAIDDHCFASCVDWYGNARPLFLRGRVFALLGYELVEGSLANGRISELRRINYSPGKQYDARR